MRRRAANSLPAITRFVATMAIALVAIVGPLASPSRAATSYVGSANLPSTDGYWLVTGNGEVTAYGNAKFLGDVRTSALNRPIVGMAGTTTGKGYWLVAGDGGIFSFGDAAFYGSTGSLHLNQPIVGMASTPSGHGYWMVASDGGIFAFGDAQFYGSTGGIRLNKPVVGMSPTRAGSGYWMVASDGGVFAFGDAAFYGSTGGINLNRPVVAMSKSSTGRGYWMVASDGGIFAFGDAPFYGSGVNASSSPTIALVPDSSGGYTIVTAGGKIARMQANSTPSTPVVVAPAPNPTNPAPTPTTPTPPATGGGSTNPGGPWQLVFNDDFNTNASEGNFLNTYGNAWKAYPSGWKDTSKAGSYDPGIISVNNGVMNMHLNTTSDGVHHVAAPYPMLPGGTNQLYGRYEVTFRADEISGYKTAWLLWPQSGTWPRDGEIDFPEGNLDGTIHAFMHRQGGSSGSDQDAYGTSAHYNNWHTATLEWMPGRMNFVLDGQLIGSSTSRVPNTPMHWVLQTESVLSGNVPSSSSGNVQIDKVSVWKYTP